LPKAHKDGEGNEYCVYHAPEGKKNVLSLDAFNRLVFDRIVKENREGRACDLSGTVFEGKIDLKGFLSDNPASTIIFSGVTFTDDLDLSGVEFAAEVDFHLATFQGRADFRGATFSSKANFEGTTFERGADFSESVFKSSAHFFDATFLDKALFTSVEFVSEIFFSIGSYKAGADFTNVKYGSTAIFKRPLAGLPQEEPKP
jgi:uncharacterized protein YjbI with pentapeptide repeats